jgi:hypothetical protein
VVKSPGGQANAIRRSQFTFEQLICIPKFRCRDWGINLLAIDPYRAAQRPDARAIAAMHELVHAKGLVSIVVKKLGIAKDI